MTEDSTDNTHKKPVYLKEVNRRSFLKNTSKIAGAALAVTLTGSLKAIPASAEIINNMNKEKPNLVFPVISDVHIQSSSDLFLDKFTETLDQLNEQVPEQDAFVIVGDVTDHGYKKEYDKLMEVYNKKKQSQIESMFAIGNHDYLNGLVSKRAQQRFLDKTGMESIYYHKIVNGYHFIVLGTENFITAGTFYKSQINWLAKQLEIAHEDDPQKPIFVFHHQPIKGTIYGSEWGFNLNKNLFYDTLSKYPQVISFSGHTHYPLEDPRIIHQKDFTSIGTSTSKDLYLEKGRLQGTQPEDDDFLNQALIVEAFDERVIIHRRNIHSNDWAGEPFEIIYPSDESPQEKFKYTDDRDTTPPYFTENSMASIVKEKTTHVSLTIALTQAEDDLHVHDYRIEARPEGEDKKDYLVFSEFYKSPMPNPLNIIISDLKPNTLYEFDVYAIDAFGNESKHSLSTMGKTSDEIPTITLSQDTLSGTEEKLEVTVKNIRKPVADWIGLYEENVEPGVKNPAIWWMYTSSVNDGMFTFTYDPKDNKHPNRYKENKSYKMVYFYGGVYDEVASQVFTIEST